MNAETANIQVVSRPTLISVPTESISQAGKTVAEIVADELACTGIGVVYVEINGCPILNSAWGRIRPAPGDHVFIFTKVHGGGDNKNPLRTILSIVVIAAATYFGGPAGFGASSKLVGAVAGATIAGVGMALVNSAFPIRMPEQTTYSYQDSPTYSLSGASNSYNPWGPVPVALGRHKVYPPFAAKPYTEIIGNDEYIRLCVLWACNPVDISSLQIGDTPIENFDDVEVETIQGLPDQENILSLFPGTVDQTDISTDLTYSGGWVTRDVPTGSDELIGDIFFTQGLVSISSSSGKRSELTIGFDVNYREKGTSTWIDLSGTQNYDAMNWTLDDSTQFYKRQSDYWPPGTYSLYALPDKSFDLVKGTAERPNAVRIAQVVGDYTTVYHGDWSWKETTFFIDSVTDLSPSGVTGLVCTKGSDNLSIDITAGSATFDDIYYTGKSTELLRFSFRAPLDRDKDYECRVQRTTQDYTSDYIFADSTWQYLRGVNNDPPLNFDVPVAATAIRIRATGQISGNIDNINAIVHSFVPVWDGSDWDSWATSSNPAALYLYVATCDANPKKRTFQQVESDDLADWYDYCTTHGWQYNMYRDFRSSPRECLADIASTGMAAVDMPNGKWSVIVDRFDKSIAQHFTQRNSWGFSADKGLYVEPHAVRVKFKDEDNDWEWTERIVYADGYDEATAEIFEAWEFPGITNSDLIWKHARRRMAQAKLRPENYSFYADFEHLACRRGSLVRMSHDVIMVGLGTGRIKNITTRNDGGTDYIDTIVVDEKFTMEAGETYAIRVRKIDGTSQVIAADTVAGESNTLYFTGVSVPAATGPGVGDLLSFGETDSETGEYLVTKIERIQDICAKIYLVDYSPDIDDADSGTIPDFDPGITVPLDITKIKPEPPTIDNIESGVRAIEIVGGEKRPRILVDVSPDPDSVVRVKGFKVRYRLSDGSNNWAFAEITVDQQTAIIRDVNEGDEYTIQAQAVSIYGVGSDWCAAETVTVTGDSIAASTDVICTDTGNTTWTSKDLRIEWTHPGVLTLSHFRVEIMDAGESTVLGSYPVENNANPAFVYTLQMNTQDHSGSASASVKLRIVSVDVNEDEAVTSIVEFTNPVPAVATALQTTAGSTTEFAGRDVDVVWTAPADTDLDGYEITVTHGGSVLRTEIVPEAHFLYTYSMNTEDGTGTPSNSVVIRVRSRDAFGQFSSSYESATFSNPAPSVPGSLSSSPWMNGIEFNWAKNTETDISHYTYRTQIESEGWTDWVDVSTPARVFVFLDDTQADAYPSGATVYFEVKAVDTFGSESSAATDSDVTGSLWIPSTALTEFEQLSGVWPGIPVPESFTWASNDPSAGYISWSAGTIYYNASTYSITGGNSNGHWIYWDPNGTTTVFVGTDDDSTIPEGSHIIAVNNSGTYRVVFGNAIANQVIGSVWIKNAAIITAKIDDLAVTNAKINDLDGAKITAGTLLVTGMSTSMQEAALNSYNVQSGNLVPNSDFSAAFDDWTTSDSGLPSVTFGIDYQTQYTLLKSHTAYIFQNSAYYDGSTAWIYMDLPVEGGKRYCFSCYTGVISCRAWLYAAWYDDSDTYISNFMSSDDNDNDEYGGQKLTDFKRLYNFADAPSNAAWLRIHLGKDDTDSEGSPINSVAFFSNVMLSEVGDDQYLESQIPPYSLSVPAGADVTSENTANNTSNVGSVVASAIAGWAYSGDNTYIDGGIIYTGTILVGGLETDIQTLLHKDSSNIVQDPDFSKTTAADDDTWWEMDEGAWGSSYGYNSSAGYRLDVNSDSSVAELRVHYYGSMFYIPAMEGDVLYFKARVKKDSNHDATVNRFAVWHVDKDYSYISGTATVDFTSKLVADTWVEVSGVITVDHSTTAYVQIGIYTYNGTQGYLYIDNVQISRPFTSSAPESSIAITGEFIGFHDTGGTWPIYIWNDSGVGKFYCGDGSNIYIEFDGTDFNLQPSEVNLLAGKDFNLIGSDTDPGKMNFVGTSYGVSMGCDVDGDRFFIEPDTDDVTSCFIGTSFFYGTNFRTIWLIAEEAAGATINNSSDSLGGGFSLNALDSWSYSRFQVYLHNLTGNDITFNFHCHDAGHQTWEINTNKQLDIFSSSYCADDAYADDWNNVADIPFLDEVDDLEAINNIKTSGVRDERTGMLLINDSTLPDWFVTQHKRDDEEIIPKLKESESVDDWQPREQYRHWYWVQPGDRIRAYKKGTPQYGPDGKPFISTKTHLGLHDGSFRQLIDEQSQVHTMLEWLNNRLLQLERAN